jgi:hypothetical protein
MGIIIVMGGRSIKASLVNGIIWLKQRGYLKMFKKTKKYLINETLTYEFSSRNKELAFENVENM